MFQQYGSKQRNAAPLNSFIKKLDMGQFVPDANSAMKNPAVPRPKTSGGQVQSGPVAPPMVFDPMFLMLAAKYFGGG